MKISSFLQVSLKFLAFSLLMLNYFFLSLIIYSLYGLSFARARPLLTRLVSITGRIGLKIMGIKVDHNELLVNPMENFLIVSNHLSYVDVLVISSFFPSCFVTSKEMKETFFLGQICLLGGCLFVDRKVRSNIHNEVRDLTRALNSGLNVAIFPEAASTDGSSLKSFKRPLFQAAIDSEAKVLPLCLNYKSIDSENITAQNRGLIFWYDDTPFLNHILKLFAQKNIVVELIALPVQKAHEFPGKVELAGKCHELIKSHYHAIQDFQ